MALTGSDQETVERLRSVMAPLIKKVNGPKLSINVIYEVAGEPPPYQIEFEAAPGPANIAATDRAKYGRAEFFGKPLATVVTTILNDFEALDIDELYDVMACGGFDFNGKSENKAKNNLKISLGKNSKFSKTPHGHYVLDKGNNQKSRKTSNMSDVSPHMSSNSTDTELRAPEAANQESESE